MLVALGATLAIALAKYASIYTRMRMYITACVSSAIAEGSLAQFAEHQLNKREIVASTPTNAPCETTPEQIVPSSLARMLRLGNSP